MHHRQFQQGRVKYYSITAINFIRSSLENVKYNIPQTFQRRCLFNPKYSILEGKKSSLHKTGFINRHILYTIKVVYIHTVSFLEGVNPSSPKGGL